MNSLNLYQLGGLLALNLAFNISGTLLLKNAALSASTFQAALGCACYVVGAALYIILLQHQSLSIMAVITSILGLVIIIGVGVIWHEDQLSIHQWLGVLLALIAVALVSVSSSKS